MGVPLGLRDEFAHDTAKQLECGAPVVTFMKVIEVFRALKQLQNLDDVIDNPTDAVGAGIVPDEVQEGAPQTQGPPSLPNLLAEPLRFFTRALTRVLRFPFEDAREAPTDRCMKEYMVDSPSGSALCHAARRELGENAGDVLLRQSERDRAQLPGSGGGSGSDSLRHGPPAREAPAQEACGLAPRTLLKMACLRGLHGKARDTHIDKV